MGVGEAVGVPAVKSLPGAALAFASSANPGVTKLRENKKDAQRVFLN